MSIRNEDQQSRRRRKRDAVGRADSDPSGPVNARGLRDDSADQLETSMDILEDASLEWLEARTTLQSSPGDNNEDESFNVDDLYGLDALDVEDTLTGIDSDTLSDLKCTDAAEPRSFPAATAASQPSNANRESAGKRSRTYESPNAGGRNPRKRKRSAADRPTAREHQSNHKPDTAHRGAAIKSMPFDGDEPPTDRPVQRAAIVRPAWWVMNLSLLCVLQAACLAMGLFTAPTVPAGSLVNGVTSLSLPWTPALSVAALKTFVWVTALQGGLCYLVFNRIYHQYRQRESRIEARFRRQQRALLKTRDAMIVGLTRLAESRDNDTQGHLDRVGMYAAVLARAAARRRELADRINERFINLIEISAALHDIGKVGISDSILLKPGRLTDDERRRMQAHTRISSDCLRRIERCLGNSNFLTMAHDIALFHHEWWNGAGYPSGISGEQIPLSARIVAIADVYDALSARRVYKEPYAHEDCLQMIVSSSGQQFDPTLVEVLQEVEAEFREIASQFPDTDPVPESIRQRDLVRDQAPVQSVAKTSKGIPVDTASQPVKAKRSGTETKSVPLRSKQRRAQLEESWDRSVDSVDIDVDEILQIVSPRPRPAESDEHLDLSATGNRPLAK